MKNLTGKNIAILVADGFEESELVQPRKALDDAGATTFLISPNAMSVKSWSKKNWSADYPVDVTLESAHAQDYDALLLPGGVANPDTLRTLPKAIEFIAAFGKAGKPIASICHGPWTLIDAQLIKGKTVTSWPSLKKDIENAGGTWVDKTVVVDGKLVTSRKPEDIPAFNEAMIELFAS